MNRGIHSMVSHAPDMHQGYNLRNVNGVLLTDHRFFVDTGNSFSQGDILKELFEKF